MNDLSDEVTEVVSGLKHIGGVNAGIAADLIERLARENKGNRIEARYWKAHAKAHEKLIEKLTKDFESASTNCNKAYRRIEELERMNLEQANTLFLYGKLCPHLQRQLDEALSLIESVIECYKDSIVGDMPTSGLVVIMKTLLENGVAQIKEMKDE